MSCRFAAVVMSHSQTDWFLHVPRDLTHAWLSPWNQHTTAGRINQVDSPFHTTTGRRELGPHRNPLLSLSGSQKRGCATRKSPCLFVTHPSQNEDAQPRSHSVSVSLCCSRSICPLHIVPNTLTREKRPKHTRNTKPEATCGDPTQDYRCTMRERTGSQANSHDSSFTLEDVFPDGGKDGRPSSLASPPDSTSDHLHL